MSNFIDGPAKGVHLSLRRSPMFLRAVCEPNGKWDALDQLTDTPARDQAKWKAWCEAEGSKIIGREVKADAEGNIKK